MLRMEQVHVIRHKHFNEGHGIRRIARDMGLHRFTVRKYLNEAEPCRKESVGRNKRILEEVGPRIDDLLEEWKAKTSRKHRITSPRVHRQLIEEGYKICERTVRKYLSEKRRMAAEVFIPLVHRPGEEAQVDFFEVSVEINGEVKRVWKFLLHLMYSKRDLVWLYERCDQISFLDGHVRAFEALGCVPHRLIYDNLTAAVKRRVNRGERELTERFVALCSHYLFEPCFARLGEGHDKGGVEGRGKTIRLQHLTPIVSGACLGEISQNLQADIDRKWEQTKTPDGRLYTELYDYDQFSMKPLPAARFEARLARPVSVSRSATVNIMGAVYSVPTRWARLEAMAYIGVKDILLVCRGEERTHEIQAKGGKSIRFRDYLSELARKPQAVRQVAPELLAELGEPYSRLWKMLESTHGVQKAARVLAAVLGAINDHGENIVSQALLSALSNVSGQVSEHNVLFSLAGHLPRNPVMDVSCIPAALRSHEIQSGCAADYDLLLTGGAL